MPVPSVVTMTSPGGPSPRRTAPRPAPAASASLTTCTSRPWRSVNSASASVPIQALSMFAAEWTTPWRTTPGDRDPDRPVASGKCPSSSAKTSATASGVEGCGRVDALPLGGEVARLEVDGRALDAGAAEVDADRVGHGLSQPKTSWNCGAAAPPGAGGRTGRPRPDRAETAHDAKGDEVVVVVPVDDEELIDLVRS